MLSKPKMNCVLVLKSEDEPVEKNSDYNPVAHSPNRPSLAHMEAKRRSTMKAVAQLHMAVGRLRADSGQGRKLSVGAKSTGGRSRKSVGLRSSKQNFLTDAGSMMSTYTINHESIVECESSSEKSDDYCTKSQSGSVRKNSDKSISGELLAELEEAREGVQAAMSQHHTQRAQAWCRERSRHV